MLKALYFAFDNQIPIKFIIIEKEQNRIYVNMVKLIDV